MKNETDNTNIDFDSQSQDKRLSSAAGLSDFGVDKAMTWTKERPTQEGRYWIGAVTTLGPSTKKIDISGATVRAGPAALTEATFHAEENMKRGSVKSLRPIP